MLNAIAIENGPVNNYQMTLSNYPNPFNPSTTIEYGLTERAKVTLTVYNRSGEQIASLVNAEKEVGYHTVKWNAGNFATGVYFCELRTGKYSSVKKLLLVK
ncbi:MAG: T9SS type A sorting domain-containing protein [Ignavibacteriales bacterium]|nr:T9SS type A sorting domain-containing protein [Ignavibacteriales bacterium]